MTGHLRSSTYSPDDGLGLPMGKRSIGPAGNRTQEFVTGTAAVGSAGEISTFNGSSWTLPINVDPNEYLVSVSCSSANFCAAVDQAGRLCWSPLLNFGVDGGRGGCLCSGWSHHRGGSQRLWAAGNRQPITRALARSNSSSVSTPERLSSTSFSSCSTTSVGASARAGTGAGFGYISWAGIP